MQNNKRKKPLGLSAREVAKLAGVHYETVLRWIRSDYLPAKLVKTKGRKKEYRVKKSDLDKILKN